MKARLKGQLSSVSQQIVNDEIRKQIIYASEHNALCFDAMVLLTLYEKYGFRKKRLRQFYEYYEQIFTSLQKYYATAPMSDKNGAFEIEFAAVEELKRAGVDLKLWREKKAEWTPETDAVWQRVK